LSQFTMLSLQNCYSKIIISFLSKVSKSAQICGLYDISSEADLGMFSMFVRTGAPTKRGPHKRTGKFLQRSNMPEIIEIITRKRKYVMLV